MNKTLTKAERLNLIKRAVFKINKERLEELQGEEFKLEKIDDGEDE